MQLDILAGRLVASSTMKVKGGVRVNGAPIDHDRFQRAACYVMQEDHLPHCETVRECLQFNADTRLPTSLSKAKKVERVNTILDDLVRARSSTMASLHRVCLLSTMNRHARAACAQQSSYSCLWSIHVAGACPCLGAGSRCLHSTVCDDRDSGSIHIAAARNESVSLKG